MSVSSERKSTANIAARTHAHTSALPTDRLEHTSAWGMAAAALNYVYRPSTLEQLRDVFALARATGRPVGMRGGGQSYGDAALNGGHILLNLNRMKLILAWDPESGSITVEPGVTIQQLWRYVLGDGWWLPVAPGTGFPTLGGCASMNIHGKNNWRAGPLGNHILEFTALLATGEELYCSRDENADLFFAFIGGLGLLGCFTSITLQLKRVYSGRYKVRVRPARNIEEMVDLLEAHKDIHEYMVGWSDGLARDSALGRGEIHFADYLAPGEDPQPDQSLRLENQDLPDSLFGIVPKSIIWMFMLTVMNNLGTKLVNFAKYRMAQFKGEHTYEQPFAAFNFLLDYVPNWKKAYQPGGLIQYQSFIPRENAARTFRVLMEHSRRAGLPTYLGVVKRHRPDDFLLTHAVDGYSLAMDFQVTQRKRERLARLAREMDEIVLAAGGRFYFAKDSTLRPEVAAAYLGEETLAKFNALKQRCDPQNLLQTNLSRRVFPGLGENDSPEQH